MSGPQSPILLLAHSGFIIRNFLLGKFAQTILRERPLLVAVPDPDDPILLELVKDMGIQLIPFVNHLDEHKSNWKRLTSWHTYMYQFKRSQKKTTSLEIQTRLYETHSSWKWKLMYDAMTLTGSLLDKCSLMGIVEDAYLRDLSCSSATRWWERLLRECQPSVMVSTMLTLCTNNIPSIDLPAVLAAKKLGIPQGTVIQSWDNLSSKTSVLPPWLDRYWTWSDTMSQQLVDLNPRVPPEKIEVVGGLQFDFHISSEIILPRSQFLDRLGLDTARPYILIGTGTPKWLPNEVHTITSLIKKLRDVLPDCQVVIRLHPKDYSDRWDVIFSELVDFHNVVIQKTSPQIHMDKGGFTPPKEFYSDQINTLVHAAVVINTASTITVDAAILDRPVISFGYDSISDAKFSEGRAKLYNSSTHFSPLVETGGVIVAYSEDECIDTIIKYLNYPMLHRTGRRKIVEIVTNQADGKAGERLADKVIELSNISNIKKPFEKFRGEDSSDLNA